MPFRTNPRLDHDRFEPIWQVMSEDDGLPIGDRHQRLLEAGMSGCCAEGDLLALMPSVDRPVEQWTDGKAWIARLLGF